MGAWLQSLTVLRGRRLSVFRSAVDWAALSSACALLLQWALVPRAPAGQLPLFPSAATLLGGAAACAAACLGAFAVAGGRKAAAAGAACGLAWGVLSLLARAWTALVAALALAGFFSGKFLALTLPVWLAAAAALIAFAIVHPESKVARGRIVAGALVLVALPAALLFWSLRARWDYGPRSLFEAAQVKVEAPAAFSVARLCPKNGQPYQVAPFSGPGSDVSYDDLAGLYRYLERCQGRSLFAREALDRLRSGWLAWWDPDRALESDLLAYPGRSAPDYLGGLGLLRAGPLTPERYAKLSAFEDQSKKSPRGFEDVDRSQLIFEAFSAAYARFGDEQKARDWIVRVDNLWPIYDKKVEVTPVESFRYGVISGSLFEDRTPATNVRVGLFYVASSTGAADSSPATLSASAFPGPDGRFRFSNLGAGRYYLALLARSELLGGPIFGAPGVVELSPDAPEALLDPISIGSVADAAPVSLHR